MSKLIVGLDLSFNSTGICLTTIDDENIAKEISFYRVVYDNETRKNTYVPKSVKNINTKTYTLPKYMTTDVLCIDDEDENNKEQIETTLRAMCASRQIFDVVYNYHQKHNHNFVIVSIENYVMPAFGGQNSLKNVSGLITLQAFVREMVLRYCNKNQVMVKMLTPSPTTLKKFFTGSGKAEKEDMMKSFVENFNGRKLIPAASEDTVKIINDVVDAFALTYYAYGKLLKYKEIEL